ncbi:MAG: hypothetical protein IJ470_04340 [Clostridia bacterium]|nr:hypothetical protein [Clostridia bacterium]
MQKNKTTKRALLSSVFALFVCLSMLIGTTFAWFTDNVSSGINKIQSGNLDVKLYADGKEVTKDTTDLFKIDAWEPGVKSVETFRVENAGTLALKYQFALNVVDYNTVKDTDKSLKDVLKVAITTDTDVTDDEAKNLDYKYNLTDLTKTGNLIKGTSDEFTVVIYWQPTNDDNAYNINNGKSTSDGQPLYINLGVNLVATQNTVENDSFGSDYDAKAWYEENKDAESFEISNATELFAFAEVVNDGKTFAGKTVKLTSDIDLGNKAWTPIGLNADHSNKFKGTFDGQGYTISNLTVNQAAGYQAAGFFGALNGTAKNFTIKNANITAVSSGAATDNGIAVVAGSIYTSGKIDNVDVINATVSGNRYVGGISGYTYGSVTNCSVTNATLTATPDKLTGSYDNGDKVGGIVGYFASENTYTVSGNEAKNITITAYRDAGGIVGAGNAETVTGNTATDIKITIDQVTYNYGDKAANAAGIVGRVLSGTVDSSNKTQTVNIYTAKAPVTVSDGEGLKQAIANIGENESVEIKLNDGKYDFKGESVQLADGVTLRGNGEVEVSNVKLNMTDDHSASFENLNFSGNTVVQANGDGELSFTDCEFNVIPDKYNGFSRAAAIIGANQYYTIDLNLQGCTFNYQYTTGNADLWNSAIFMWSNVNFCVIKDCTFNNYGFMAVKLMNVAENAEIIFEGNIFNMSKVGAANYYNNNAVQIMPQHNNTFSVACINNTFNGDYEDNGSVVYVKGMSSLVLTKCTLTHSGNIINGVTATDANFVIQ